MGTATEALARLRAAADRIAFAWPEMEWNGPGPASPLVLARGEFRDLAVAPGGVLELRSRLNVGGNLEGVDIAGDALDVMVHSIYPLELEYDGAPAYHEKMPVGPPGPAFLRVAPDCVPSDDRELFLPAEVHTCLTRP